MATHHVFVETNWVVALVAPALSRSLGAAELLERSRRGELILHVPAIALVEARKVIRERSPRTDLENIRTFVHDLKDRKELDELAADAAFDVLSRFQQYVAHEKLDAPKRIAQLAHEAALELMPLDEPTLSRSTQLAADTGLQLQPFDFAILASVLARGELLSREGSHVSFCTLDSDLQPWDRNGTRKHELSALLEAAGVWVYGDFILRAPERPDPWPSG